MTDFAPARAAMVERHLARRDITDPLVLAAMGRVKREDFVEPGQEEFAYEDAPLTIGSGQTISQPYIVALMIQAVGVRPGDRVLEIGTGSGYAAAVLAEIAGEVYTVERHGTLAMQAAARFLKARLGHVHVRTGDGTLGWPEAAPFDAILIAASGPDIPPSLLEQMTIGGRLVMPVGDRDGVQRLIRLTRQENGEWTRDDLGGVRFVPLIGAGGWPDGSADADTSGPSPRRQPTAAPGLPALIRRESIALPDIDDPAFAAEFDRFATARVVLLGESSHGTSEFYRARAAITRRLVERHGFRIVAAEADWPDAASLDRYVRDRPPPDHAEPPFRRFPTWMWRNAEVEAFIESLRTWNRAQEPARRAGFYGLDLYNLSASIRAVLDYLDRVDPEAASVARRRYGCLTPWAREPAGYGRMALSAGYPVCESAVLEILHDLQARQSQYAAADEDRFLDAESNARLVKNAEAYYRAMYYGGAESWNRRDTHMFETLCGLLDAKGPGAKAVVWAHNSHIGDASHTEMGQVRGELNIGQLCRQRFGTGAALIGFGTHTGTVACASDWDEPMELKRVNPSLDGSIERLMHDSGAGRFLLDLRNGPLREALAEPRLERFIGVIYRPDTERWSHYAEASLAPQFDGFVWFDDTRAVTPLLTAQRPGMPETYPFGL